MDTKGKINRFMGYELKSGRKYPLRCVACGGSDGLPHSLCNEKQNRMRECIESDLGLL